MARVIINHNDDIDNLHALCVVEAVMMQGRFDGAYAFHTSFKDGTEVIARKTPKGTDTFDVIGGKKRC